MTANLDESQKDAATAFVGAISDSVRDTMKDHPEIPEGQREGCYSRSVISGAFWGVQWGFAKMHGAIAVRDIIIAVGDFVGMIIAQSGSSQRARAKMVAHLNEIVAECVRENTAGDETVH